MNKFIYKILKPEDDYPIITERQINELAKEGWRVVASLAYSIGSAYLILEKPASAG